MEEDKLKRLQRINAPERSTRWVKQQIAYLRSDKPYNLSRKWMKARVILSGPSYVDTGVHEWCSSLYPHWGMEEVLCKAAPITVYLRPEAEGNTSQKDMDVSVPNDINSFSFGFPYENKWPTPIKVFDRGRP